MPLDKQVPLRARARMSRFPLYLGEPRDGRHPTGHLHFGHFKVWHFHLGHLRHAGHAAAPEARGNKRRVNAEERSSRSHAIACEQCRIRILQPQSTSPENVCLNTDCKPDSALGWACAKREPQGGTVQAGQRDLCASTEIREANTKCIDPHASVYMQAAREGFALLVLYPAGASTGASPSVAMASPPLAGLR